MRVTLLLSILLVLSFAPKNNLAQNNKKELALKKGKEAIMLMDNGKFDQSIDLLQEAQKLDPENINYPYEIGYAYYAKREYKKAIKFLEPIQNHSNTNDRVFQLLGNSYDNNKESEKAIETYLKGLAKFPNSGNLHLELGIMEMDKKSYNKALNYFEKGIDVAPNYASNYYWAAKIFCASTEEVWGMIYGELFLNLERNTNRTEEISKLLFDTYKSEIQVTSDTSYTVSFSKNSTIPAEALSDPSKMKLPFGLGFYEPTLMISIVNQKEIDIHSLNIIRSNFVNYYFKNGSDKSYPNILFNYQKRVQDAGYLEPYNYWILMKGDEKKCSIWINQNKEKWNSFLKWYNENGLSLNQSNKFIRSQY
jgi:tetratricopeptide (TPR) repeat protein